METRARLGPYRLDELTGEGGVARVYKAWHTKLQRYEALKLLRDSMAHEATIVARFLSEARTAAKLHHPNIATIYSVGDGDGSQPYFTMEMVEGCDLGEHLRRHGPLTLEEATPLLHQIASAVDYAHSVGVIHRDIKPANILLGNSPSGGYAIKLVDFGIARVQAEEAASRLTQTGGIVGTPKYISPEQANEQPVDYRADIYSLGVVAYEMMCGRTPFEGSEPATTMALLMAHVHTAPPPPRDLTPALSQTTNDALLRSLAKSPEERFNSCGEFVRVLTAPRVADAAKTPIQRITEAPPLPAPRVAGANPSPSRPIPVVPAERPAPSARPKRMLWALTGASAVALLTLAAVFALTRPSPRLAPKGPATSISARKDSPPAPPRDLHASSPVLLPSPVAKISKTPLISAAPKARAAVTKAPTAPSTLHATAKALASKTGTATAKVLTASPAVHAAATRPNTLKTAPKLEAIHLKSAVHPKLASSPAKPAATSVAHSAKPRARPAVYLAKRIPRFAKAHAPVRYVREKNRRARRISRPLRTHTAGHSHQRHALADAWVSSSRQEMALAHSFHAKGDSVQAAALAQNAADSQRHALGAPLVRKRKRH